MGLGELACGAAVKQVVAIDRLNSGDGLVDITKCQKTASGRHAFLEARRLNQRGLAGTEITGSPIADPSAVRVDVTLLGHAEFPARRLNELPIALRVARMHARVQ